MPSLSEIQSLLEALLEDSQLTTAEKHELRELATGLDDEQLRFLRNRAFGIARKQLSATDSTQQPDAIIILRWLEQITKVIDLGLQQNTLVRSAHFSPGDSCLNKLADLCHQAQSSIDICVFTIAEDRLSEAIIRAHQRGVRVRIITDNDKSEDMGSDIEQLKGNGIALRMDNSPYHMHHKFAIFDQQWLTSGSFNWTRSATTKNEENIIVINDLLLIKEFQEQFDRLWLAYRD